MMFVSFRRAILALALALVPVGASAQVLPGQIIIDPEHPQWLMRAGGEHLFICGPGDPEAFLYRGTRLADGTRDGDQDEILDKLISFGGNAIYLQVIRSHGGDGQADHNPFVNSDPGAGLDEDILVQWEGWFDRMEAAGIVIYMFLFDDSANVFGGGNPVPPDEESFLRAIVDRFQRYPNLIWLVAEESEEAFSHARVRNIAAVIADADEHDHIIGNHHHPGTQFLAWAEGSALNHFSMQTDAAPGEAHAAAIEARAAAEAAGSAGNGYMVMHTEAAFLLTADTRTVRSYMWDTAMAGVMPLIFGMDVATTAPASLMACRIVQEFFEATRFQTMVNRDDLATGGSRWVLADEPSAYIVFAEVNAGDLGLADMSSGYYDLTWVDVESGATIVEHDVVVEAGSNSFKRPGEIGGLCAVSLTRVWRDLGQALPGMLGPPRLELTGSMAPGSAVDLSFLAGPRNAPLALVVGDALLGLPFAGGTFVPVPALILPAITDIAGELHVESLWPAGLPSGISVYVQAWCRDTTTAFGLSASNAVEGVTP